MIQGQTWTINHFVRFDIVNKLKHMKRDASPSSKGSIERAALRT